MPSNGEEMLEVVIFAAYICSL